MSNTMKLSEWGPIQNASEISKEAQRFLDKKIVKVISQYKDSIAYGIERKKCAPFKTKYVFTFVVLENGYAVGFNENPARGWSFPVVKYRGAMKSEIGN